MSEGWKDEDYVYEAEFEQKQTETEGEIIQRLGKEIKELKDHLISVDKHIERSMAAALKVLPLLDDKHRQGYIVGLQNFSFALGPDYYNLFSKLENMHRNEVL